MICGRKGKIKRGPFPEPKSNHVLFAKRFRNGFGNGLLLFKDVCFIKSPKPIPSISHGISGKKCENCNLLIPNINFQEEFSAG